MIDKKVHEVSAVQFDNYFLYLLVDEQAYRIQWKECSERLLQAQDDQRRFVRVSPSGYGLHWPLVDEDLAIDPLLQHAQKLNAFPDTMSSGETLVEAR